MMTDERFVLGTGLKFELSRMMWAYAMRKKDLAVSGFFIIFAAGNINAICATVIIMVVRVLITTMWNSGSRILVFMGMMS